MMENIKERVQPEAANVQSNESDLIVTAVQGNRNQINADFIKHVKMIITENKYISNLSRFRNVTSHLGYGSTDEEIEDIMRRTVSDVDFEITADQSLSEIANIGDVTGKIRVRGVEYNGTLTPETTANKFKFHMDYEITKLMGQHRLNYFFNIIQAETWMIDNHNRLDGYMLYVAIVTYAFNKVASNPNFKESDNPVIFTSDNNACVECDIRIVNPPFNELRSISSSTKSMDRFNLGNEE